MGQAVRRTLAALVVTAVLSGCTLTNPHLTWKRPETASPVSEDKLRWAIAYADNAKAAYKKALGEQSSLNAWLGIGLIPLAAAAAGLGVTGGPPTAIAALATAGAAGYGIGTWLSSKPAQRAWVAGYNATSCAVDAMLPLLVIEDDMTTLRADILAIDTSAVEQRSLDLHRFHASKTVAKELLDQADAAEATATALVAGAKSVQATANDILVDARGGGRRLTEAVDGIAGKVSAGLVENGPDLQALASIIGGLARSYGQFAQLPEGAKPTSTSKKLTPEGQASLLTADEQLLTDEMLALSAESAKLARAVEKVAGPINAVARKKPVETLKACGVTAEQVGVALSIDPPGRIEMAQGAAAASTRVIKGGAAPFAVTLTGSAVEGLRVQQPMLFGPLFVVETTDKTPAAVRTVVVSDRSGNHAIVDVAVQPKASSKPDAPGGAAGGTSKARTLDELTTQLPRAAVQLAGGTVTYVDALAQAKMLDVFVVAPAAVADTTIAADVNAKAEPDVLKDVTVRITRLTPATATLAQLGRTIRGSSFPLPGGVTMQVKRAALRNDKLEVAVGLQGVANAGAVPDATIVRTLRGTSGAAETDIVVTSKTVEGAPPPAPPSR